MTSLFGGGQPKVIPEFTGLQVNTAVQVLPVPIVYGSPRVSINLIYYNGFNSQLVQQGSGGKGILSGGKGGSDQVEYFATLILGICEGPIGNPLVIYQDQEVWTPATFPSNGAFFFNGTTTQSPWSYVTATWPGDARGYINTAYYAFQNAQLDASATVPQIDLVLQGLLQGSSPLNNSTLSISTGQYDSSGNPLSFIGNIPLGDADADPGAVIYDFLSNSVYGATFPVAYVDTTTLFTSSNGFNPSIGDAAIATYCQAVGLAWSVVVNNVESANSILDRWCKNLNTAPVWDGALLKFIPYWDTPASGNPGWDSGNGIALKYYTPYTIPVVQITLDYILQSDDKTKNPITFTRKDPLEVYNTVRVDFKDRTNFFNDVPAEAKDEVHAELYGPKVDNIGLADEFSLATYANLSATMQLRRNISIMNNYAWKMGPLWGWLVPMIMVNIPDPTNYANFITVRIISVEDDEEENVSVTAEAFPLGAQSPTILPMSPTTPPNQGPVNSAPSPVYPPVIFAPPTDMLTATGFATPQVVFGASGGNLPSFAGQLDPNWGGCNIWVSLDNISYQLLGTLWQPSIIGNLSATLAGYGGANPDNINTLYVNLSECDGALASVSSDAAASGHSICCLQDPSGFEILAFTNAALIGPDQWALTGLYRGLYGTTSRSFGGGSQFLYVGSSSNIFETNLPAAYVGQSFWVKPQSFNVYNNAVEDLSTTPAYRYTATGPIPGPPIPPPSTQAATYRRKRAPVIATKLLRKDRRKST